ncbi:unnamed protein product [Adineta steineri]|uniref:Methyltransferase FkbM domain-containing protein n=1 Tax=Adineta steineri TaxID=433720 RepID=A0A813M1G0_9BILA|nr:unnamed protein product [Adineta steineri]CAF4265012.1 unnamed protein product [Adineta steineri]
MNDRLPSFKLATIDADKPYADGDLSQATVVNSLHLVNRCKQDPSLIVVDVGALFGEFGLYAAACGCQVYIFEVQPEYADLIRTSAALNNFSTSRVHILEKAVSNLPTNSKLTFSQKGGQTKASEGNLTVSAIRLDDVGWPSNSTILLLKIDVEGFELNVLRSAEKLFSENRIHHLIFEYTAWWTDRGAQKDLIPYVENTLKSKQLFALDRTASTVYGPLKRQAINHFHSFHISKRLQTDIYARFVEPSDKDTLEIEPYYLGISFA